MGEAALAFYRLYQIKKDGHVAGPAIEFDLPNDAAMLKEAKQLLDERDIEIWQGARLVAYLTPDEK